jgi:hypothetical protein
MRERTYYTCTTATAGVGGFARLHARNSDDGVVLITQKMLRTETGCTFLFSRWASIFLDGRLQVLWQVVTYSSWAFLLVQLFLDKVLQVDKDRLWAVTVRVAARRRRPRTARMANRIPPRDQDGGAASNVQLAHFPKWHPSFTGPSILAHRSYASKFPCHDDSKSLYVAPYRVFRPINSSTPLKQNKDLFLLLHSI